MLLMVVRLVKISVKLEGLGMGVVVMIEVFVVDSNVVKCLLILFEVVLL